MIHLTYTGSCEIDGKTIMCSNMSSSLDQKVLFYDHIVGLRDSLSDQNSKKGPSGSASKVQKKTYRYSPAIGRANISAPVPEKGFDNILNKAIKGDTIEVVMTFYRDSAPRVTVGQAIISTFSLDIKAGDIATFNMDIVGSEYTLEQGATAKKSECAKLVTWGACHVEATPIVDPVSSFNISINNPPVPIYTTKWTQDTASNGMMPQKIRIGVQAVTGTIGVYGPVQINTPSKGQVKFSLPDVSKTVQCVFVQPKDDASTSLYIRTITFNGVNDGPIWS